MGVLFLFLFLEEFIWAKLKTHAREQLPKCSQQCNFQRGWGKQDTKLSEATDPESGRKRSKHPVSTWSLPDRISQLFWSTFLMKGKKICFKLKGALSFLGLECLSLGKGVQGEMNGEGCPPSPTSTKKEPERSCGGTGPSEKAPECCNISACSAQTEI